jgi:hypothetical protein
VPWFPPFSPVLTDTLSLCKRARIAAIHHKKGAP